jgi:hypothetical protein
MIFLKVKGFRASRTWMARRQLRYKYSAFIILFVSLRVLILSHVSSERCGVLLLFFDPRIFSLVSSFIFSIASQAALTSLGHISISLTLFYLFFFFVLLLCLFFFILFFLYFVLSFFCSYNFYLTL